MNSHALINTAIVTLALTGISFSAKAAEPLNIKDMSAAETSFGMNAPLVTGEKEVATIGLGVIRADAVHVAAAAPDSGNVPKPIVINDIDLGYNFTAGVLNAMSPAIELAAIQSLVDKITSYLQAKLKVWGPIFQAKDPQTSITALQTQYPDPGLTLALEMNAKTEKEEICR